MKEWEKTVNSSKDNLWLVTTKLDKLLCVKFRGRFFVKDGANMMPVKCSILDTEQL